jgi:hypothetical protein
VVISVAASVPTSYLEQHLGERGSGSAGNAEYAGGGGMRDDGICRGRMPGRNTWRWRERCSTR